MKSIKNKLLNGFAWSLADKVINQLGYLAITIFLARHIGPESFGFIGMLTIFILLTESVVNNGFSQALVQRSQQVTEQDCSTVFYINIIWGALIYLLLYFSAPSIARFYQEPLLVDISRLLFLVVIINSLTVVVRAKLIIDVDFKSQTIASTIATILSGALGIGLVLNGYEYWSLVWMILIKAVIQSVVLWFFCRWIPSERFNKQSFHSLFRFGSNLMLAGFVATLVNNLYIALIGRYYSATQVGYFTQATNLSNYLMQFITSTLQGVTYPIMTSLKEDREQLVNVYKQLISITMLVSLPMLIGFAAISREVVLITLGEEWLPVVPVLIALCLARTITPISAINMNILNAIGRSDLFLKVDLSKLPMTLLALYLALPYGIEAIAWAMVFTSFISFFINAYFPGKMFGFGAIAQLKVASKYIVASIVMFFAVWSITIHHNMFVNLFIKVFAGFFIYTVLISILRDKLFLSNVSHVLLIIKRKYNYHN
ncbi:lipopolysaccharide biosynthesis protein [Vibrio metschnikovii]|uniref:lipopolysaccharide biosynthesis protein n=1 Tax=Vibrio metschnikovii TaxID=28172 RepID=UPI002FC72EB4